MFTPQPLAGLSYCYRSCSRADIAYRVSPQLIDNIVKSSNQESDPWKWQSLSIDITVSIDGAYDSVTSMGGDVCMLLATSLVKMSTIFVWHF